MAHANPEFVLGLMQHSPIPVSHQAPRPASLGELRAKMRDIGDRLENRQTVTAAEEQAYRIWRDTVRRERLMRDMPRPADAISDGPAMHGAGRRGERFTEPKRRYPSDVQAGRTKIRRGTLTR